MTLAKPAILPLKQALALHSPRLSRRPITYPSILIRGSVLVLFFVLATRPLYDGSLLAWSSGIIYIFYDTALLLLVFRNTLPLLELKKQRELDVQGRPRVSVGVVIAAYNEAEALPDTLAAVLGQSLPVDEILIADDGSNDGTPAMLTARFKLTEPQEGEVSAPSPLYPNLRWLKLAHRGKSEALNSALPQLRAQIVMTIDADTILSPAAVNAMRSAFEAEDHLAAATGVLIPVCPPTATGKIMQWFQRYEYMRNFLSRFAWTQADSLLLISGAFAGFRRTALMTVGGFDPECLVEDYEVIHRLHRYSADNGLGWRFRVIGSAIAQTHAPSTINAFLRQRRRWFAGFLQTQHWNRDMLGNARYHLLGTLMLPIKAIDTLQPVYGLTAIAILFAFLANGKLSFAIPAFGFITAKIMVDIAFYVWAIRLYRLWVGKAYVSYKEGIMAALFEPFSFQVLRHVGASLGWITFLRGKKRWN
jgi:cellulose synthase/poly-beta-1,6-N-acetylglucosamine synthase-like glycosyltransferase